MARAQRKGFWVTELQAEPWERRPLTALETADVGSASPALLNRGLRLVRAAGAERVYLWGRNGGATPPTGTAITAGWTRPSACFRPTHRSGGRTDEMIDVERQRASLAAELLGWMGEPAAALFPVDGPPDRDEARFADLALRVFAYQYAANEPYRRYCDRRGVRPGAVRRWQEIPAVATDAFKETPLTCFPSDDAAVVFVTSGTTQQARHGRHYLRSLDLYHAALAPAFAAHVLPGGARLPAVVLAFSSARMPQSSLSHMFDVVVERLCDGGDWYLEPDGLAVEATIRRLTALAAQDRPVLLMGTAFAFVHLLDALVADGRRLALPPGSRIMDTGGYKGARASCRKLSSTPSTAMCSACPTTTSSTSTA
ncbi:MAG: hypothetical protein U0531_19085 [Dehalococcoidia bacterium]